MFIKSISVVVLTALAISVRAHDGRVTVHVTDENGIAISNAQAIVQFENILPPGEGWGSGRPTEGMGLTDTNGNCKITGNSIGGSVSIVVRKDGYYYGNGRILFTNVNLILNRWLPWNSPIEVVLQKKGIQVPMYVRRVNEVKIPTEGKPIGFDLVVGDWVAPYGKGETSDFLFKFDSKSELKPPPREFQPYDVTWTLNFSDDGGGIQFATTLSHDFRVISKAPTNGYEPQLVKHNYKEIGQPARIDFHEGQNYFFRVRIKKDAQGNIVSALYGKVSGDFKCGITGQLTFTYYLNPEPNSCDMEFDPSRNLFKHLSPQERVSAP